VIVNRYTVDVAVSLMYKYSYATVDVPNADAPFETGLGAVTTGFVNVLLVKVCVSVVPIISPVGTTLPLLSKAVAPLFILTNCDAVNDVAFVPPLAIPTVELSAASVICPPSEEECMCGFNFVSTPILKISALVTDVTPS